METRCCYCYNSDTVHARFKITPMAIIINAGFLSCKQESWMLLPSIKEVENPMRMHSPNSIKSREDHRYISEKYILRWTWIEV